MDFYNIKTRKTKSGNIEVYPDFVATKSKDLMVRGNSFFAVWDEANHIWSTDEYKVQQIIDNDIRDFAEELKQTEGDIVRPKYMKNFSSRIKVEFDTYLKHTSDNWEFLDSKMTFKGQNLTRTDYASMSVPYELAEGNIGSYDKLMSTLYSNDERQKLEWGIGAMISGDSRDIDKFFVLYGSAGTGKSTVLNIMQMLFEGYYTTFEAKQLGLSNNAFATSAFKNDPLLAIQHDGDLSRIEDNATINSIVSHEPMVINEKFKPSYTTVIHSMMFMGTNKPVRITDAKSGIIRRLVDVQPTGNKIPMKEYQVLMSQIGFELGAIAYHCLNVYRKLGKSYFAGYRPMLMMQKTDVFFNYVEDSYDIFKHQEYTTLDQAWSLYKQYCEESLIEFKTPKYKFREELRNYFESFDNRKKIGETMQFNVFSGFKSEKFALGFDKPLEKPISLVLDSSKSVFDEAFASYPAQYANKGGTPNFKWDNVDTILSDLDTSRLHYVKPPQNHIVIDFDLKNDEGDKDAEKNLEEASKWPSTYAEYSKSGGGVHLHYIYDGDVTKLKNVYSNGIEIKTFTGGASLRRKLSKCNTVPIAHISSGLPIKEEKVINFEGVKSEKALRTLIERNLRREIHPGTKPSINFICTILDEAYESDLKYDVEDMRPSILSFALRSSNWADYCVKVVSNMKFHSEDYSEAVESPESEPIVFFDCEVFPNLFLINWKTEGEGKEVVRMINPTANEVGELIKKKLVGFNCRRYDNHILYAAFLGYSNLELYELSQKIVNGDRKILFGEAYNLSYTDVYDFSSIKQSLKKFEISLGIHHQELGLPWDQPVDESLWTKVAEYCDNDVIATEAVFNARKEDFAARKILASLSGLSVNDTTNSHSARIIFGNDRNPQSEFVYTDLSEMFPGYKYEFGHSSYRGEEPGEGGYVYSQPGMYSNVALLDIASMHPTSIEQLNLFGTNYTAKFSQIKQARVAIKHHDVNKARELLGNAVSGLDLKTDEDFSSLAGALKIVINSVYGLTSARFPNKFKDNRNVDNIVAKRGSLFMIDLKNACQDKGWTVVHIKTDSIKLANATDEMISFVESFGKKYGYVFEHEATYDRIALVNNSVYIAKLSYGDDGMRPSKKSKWTATGAQFAQPYVFKTLFSKEEIEFKDMCETKTVTTALYLDMNEGLPTGVHDYHFVGKAGLFTPILPGHGGGELVRNKNDKYYSATGAKGWRWLESETVKTNGKESSIDRGYYDKLVQSAVDNISQFGDFEMFVSD